MASPARKLSELFYELRARTEFLDKDLAQSQRSFGKLTDFVLKNPVAAITAVGVAIVGVAVKATQMAERVQRGFGDVQRSIGATSAEMRRLGDEVSRLSKETGRSQEELSQAAAFAAKSASSTEEIGQRLRAALEVSQATGDDLTSVLGSLDQVLDTFNKSGKDSAETLATLFAAARGRQPLGDLFTAIQTAQPSIAKLNLDLSTAARALVALGEEGKSPMQAARALKQFANDGAEGRRAIEELAASIPLAADPMRDLATAAEAANNTVGALSARLHAEFDDVLIRLGNEILPKVVGFLQDIEKLFFSGGAKAATNFRNNLGTIQAFASDMAAARTEADAGGVSFREYGRAIEQMAEAVRKNEDALSTLSPEQLIGFIAALQKVQDVQFLTEKQRRDVKDLLDAITRMQTAAARTPSATGAPSRRTGGGGGGVSDEDAAAAEKVAKAVRDLGQAFDDLFAQARAGDLTLAQFDQKMRELGDRFTDVGKPTKDQADRFKALVAEAANVRGVLETLNTSKATREIDNLLASMTTTAVDDMRLALDRLKRDVLSNPLIPPERREEIIALEESFIQLTKDLEDRQQQIANAVQVNFELPELLVQQIELQEKLNKLAGKGAQFDRERVAIQKALATVMARIAALKGEEQAATVEITAATKGWVSQMAEVANVAFGIATAIEGADSNIARAIGSTAQLLTQMSLVVDAVSKAGSLSQLLSTGGGALTLLSGIGGVVGAASALVSLFNRPEDPAEARAREQQIAAHQELIAALDRVRDSIGDLAGFGSSGADISAVRNVALTQRTRTGGITGLEEIDFFRPVQDVLADLRKLGVGLDDLRDIARDADITLSESPTIAELQRLQQVLSEIDFRAFIDTFEGQMQRLSLQFEIFGALFDEPAERFAELIKLLNDPKVGAPALFGALRGLDAATEEGRDAIRKIVQDLFTRATAGQITAEELNGLALDEFLQVLAQIIRDLGPEPATAPADAADPGGERSSISRDARALTEITGNRMADYLATLLVIQRDALEAINAIASGTVRVPAAQLVQPPSLASVSTTNIQGGVVVNLGGLSLTTTINANTTDPTTLAQDFATATMATLAREVARVIAADIKQSRRFSGDSSLTS
jgi:methyl-accepting chemotaxis protein